MDFTREDIKKDTQEIVNGAIEQFAQIVGAGFEAVDKRFDRLETDVSGLKTDVSGLKEDVSILKTESTRTQVLLEDLNSKVDAMGELVVEIPDIKRRVTRLEEAQGLA